MHPTCGEREFPLFCTPIRHIYPSFLHNSANQKMQIGELQSCRAADLLQMRGNRLLDHPEILIWILGNACKTDTFRRLDAESRYLWVSSEVHFSAGRAATAKAEIFGNISIGITRHLFAMFSLSSTIHASVSQQYPKNSQPIGTELSLQWICIRTPMGK